MSEKSGVLIRALVVADADKGVHDAAFWFVLYILSIPLLPNSFFGLSVSVCRRGGAKSGFEENRELLISMGLIGAGPTYALCP